MTNAEANCAWVRDRIAARGLTQQIESMAALAKVCGYSTWFACQQDLDAPELVGLHGPALTKALLTRSSKS